eukprot:668980_1
MGDSQSNLGDSQSIQGDSQSIQKPKKRAKRVALNWWEQEAPQPKRRAIAKSMEKTALVEVEQKTEFAGETLVIKKKVEKGSAADLKFQKKRNRLSPRRRFVQTRQKGLDKHADEEQVRLGEGQGRKGRLGTVGETRQIEKLICGAPEVSGSNSRSTNRCQT